MGNKEFYDIREILDYYFCEMLFNKYVLLLFYVKFFFVFE